MRKYFEISGGAEITLELTPASYPPKEDTSKLGRMYGDSEPLAEFMAHVPSGTLNHAFKRFAKRYPAEVNHLVRALLHPEQEM